MIRLICLGVVALSMGLATTASASGPVATASKTCSLTLNQQRHSGATYLIQLKVNRVSCSTGLSIEKAWQSCRKSTAGHRTCKRRVSGYKCTQKILASSKTQYDARVTCTKGSASVVFTYTQNT